MKCSRKGCNSQNATIKKSTRTNKDGTKVSYYYCSDCQAKRAKEYYQRNRAEVLARIRQSKVPRPINNNERLIRKYATM